MALTERLALVIDARTGGAVRDLQKVQREVGALQAPVTRTDRAFASLGQTFGVSGQALKAGLGTAAVAGGFALVSLTKRAIDSASALEEQRSATEALFGSSSQIVGDFAATAAENFGLSERAALQASNQFASFFDRLGLGDQVTAEMSTALTALSADITSLFDLGDGEAIQKLVSGLAGETEAVRRFGIDLSAINVEAVATELGMEKVNGQLTEQQKILARLHIILQDTEEAHGNYSQTADSLANRQRTLTGEVENFAASLGSVVSPALADFVGDITSAVIAVRELSGTLADAWDAIPGSGAIETGVKAFTRWNIVTGPVTAAGFAFDKLGFSTDKAATSADNASSSYRSLAGSIPRYVRILNNAEQSQSEFNDELGDVRGVFLGAMDAEASYERALDGIDDAASNAARAHQDLADAQENHRRTIADLNIEVERNERAVTSAARAVTRAQRDLAEANEDLAEARENYNKVLEDFSPNSRRAHEALEDLEDAERRQEDAQFNAEDAAYGLIDAQRTLTDTTQELRDELNGVGPSADRVRDAQERVRESSDDLRDAEANLARETINLELALAEQRDTLSENSGEFEKLIGWLETLNQKYPGVFDGMLWRAAALRNELEALNTALTPAGAASLTLLGQIFALIPGLGGTPPDPRLDPNHPFPPVPLVPEQNQGKSVSITQNFYEKAEPMHVAREVKRALVPGG